MNDIRDALREGRERKRDDLDEAGDRRRFEAHWDRLHRQLDSLPLRIVGVQILVGLAIWILFVVIVEYRNLRTL